MLKIAQEYELSKKYYLDWMDAEKRIVELSKENVARVEAMIRFNSSYAHSFSKEEVDSSPHYFVELRKCLIDKKRISDSEYRELIGKIVERLDKENSTRLNSDGRGIQTMTERICKYKKSDLVHYLKDPIGTDYKLLYALAEKTEPSGMSAKGNRRRGRRNPSFASKFCHYACFYLFEGMHEQDNYSIYDSVVKKALPRYMELYQLKKQSLDDYVDYQGVIDEIIRKSKSGISRNGFDHLLWYCYK